MKKLSVFLLLFCFVAFSCKKKDQTGPTTSPSVVLTDDTRCISRVRVAQTAFSIDSSAFSEAVDLYNANHLPFNYLRWYRATREYILLDGVNNYYFNVRGDEYMNGLRLLGGICMIHEFKNGVIDFQSGTTVPTSSLDTIPVLRLSQVRAAYVNQLLTNYGGNYRALQDSCLTAEFGYYDLNIGHSSVPNYSKAWMVYPTGSYSQLPVGYFKDDGSLISFTDGRVE